MTQTKQPSGFPGRFRIKAQKKLERAKQDLTKVLAEASTAVADVLGTDTKIKLSTSSRTVEGLQTRFAESMGLAPSSTKEKYSAIKASKGQSSVELAEVEFSETGYPVSFILPGNYLTAHKEEDLVNAVEEILSS